MASNAWKSYRGAPSEGALICDVADIPDQGTHCIEVDGFPILLIRQAGVVTAFVNACPHQFLPLNHKGERMLSADGKIVRCTNHAAGFDAVSGKGVEGLGLGACLDRIPVENVDGRIRIMTGGS